MDIHKIDGKLSVAGQLAAENMAEIAAAGFKSVICNRPDHEGPGQPNHTDIAHAAQKAGLTFHYVPVISGGLTHDDVVSMKHALAHSATPILAFCRSGARSANIYQLATADVNN
jgi:uncharacterized protein (TIGR01244 family)